MSDIEKKKNLKVKPKVRIITKPTEEDLRVNEAVVIFGRFNPPTVGHEMMIEKARQLAEEKGADLLVYLSHSYDPKRNPLKYEDKLALCQEAFGDVVKDSDFRNIFDVLENLNDDYDSITIVVGKDRVKELSERVISYNGSLFEYNLDFFCAGERNGVDLVSSASASLVREMANAGVDITEYLPENIRQHAEMIAENISHRTDYDMVVSTTADGKKIWKKNRKVLTKDRKMLQKTNLITKPDQNVMTPRMTEAKEEKLSRAVYDRLQSKLKKKRNRLLRQYKALEDDG